jgi:CheY-like chemotaxis protein
MTENNGKPASNETGEMEGTAPPGRSVRELVHALNNVFTVIQLNASMALENLAAGQAVREEIQEILDAVHRGRALSKEISAAQRTGTDSAQEHELAPPVASSATPGGIFSRQSGKDKKIMFIDDEADLAQLGLRVLRNKGYQVGLFTDSREALQVFAADPQDFDLVVTDQNMPGLNGVELAGRILRIRPEIPILLCTGYCTDFSRRNLKEYGFCEVLAKPYQPTELLAVIGTLLRT